MAPASFRSALPWPQWLAGQKQPDQSAAVEQHQALDMQGWASVALPGEVPAPVSACVPWVRGLSSWKDRCQLHLSQCVTLPWASWPGDGKEGILPDANTTLTHLSAKCLWQGPSFPCNICFPTCKSGTETQILNLSLTESSIYQWHSICLSSSFFWAVKLQNEPLQQKAHLIQTASVHLWVEKYVKSHLYFIVY